MNKSLIAISIFSIFTAHTALAAGEVSRPGDNGSIIFTGVISDATCNIELDKADGSVDLGRTTLVALKESGETAPKTFTFNFKDCANKTEATGEDPAVALTKANITFKGSAAAADDSVHIVSGVAGAGVRILNANDGTNSVIKPNQEVEFALGANSQVTLAAQIAAYDKDNLKQADLNTTIQYTVSYN